MKVPKVIIAGAGPGDVELITVKAAHWLSKADYILTDRLVNEKIITTYANPNAKIIYVGKQGGKSSISQEEINSLLVQYGQENKLTMRLKGGDVAFFSQVLFEIRALNEAGIPFEIVPGVTSVSGASASMKIPLTAKGTSRGVRILTYLDGAHFTETDWLNMGHTTDTLVFYMASKGLTQLISSLRQHSTSDKTMAIIEQATTPQQRVLASSIFNFEKDLADIVINQPALVVIGEVLKMSDSLFEETTAVSSFFKEN